MTYSCVKKKYQGQNNIIFIIRHNKIRTEFGYKLICSQFNKIIHVYFSHMTYLMSHVTFLNNICG